MVVEERLDPVWRDIKSSVLASLKLEGKSIPANIDDLVDIDYSFFLNDMNSLPFESEDNELMEDFWK